MIVPRTPSPELSATTGFDDDPLSHLSESNIRRLALERLHYPQVRQLFELPQWRTSKSWLAGHLV
jgi:hypothetical protein